MLSKEQLAEIKFTNLVQHSDWTIPLGVGKVKKQIPEVVKKGLNGFVITDHNVMSGVLETYFLSKDKDFLEKLKIKSLPIGIGARLDFTDDLSNKDLSRLFSLTLYAKSQVGYKNLIYLNSISSDPEHYHEQNRLSIGELMERSEDLVVGSGGINGILAQAIVKNTGQEEDLAQIFKENFGDNFFIEIHYHPQKTHWDATTKKYVAGNEDIQKMVNLRLFEIAKKFEIKCCLVQNSYMTSPKHYLIQNILIQNHPDYKKSGWVMDQAYSLMSVEEMYSYIQENSSYITDEQFIEMCQNTQFILDKISKIKLDFTPSLPKILYNEHEVNVDVSYETKLNDLRTKMVGFSDLMVYLIDKSLNDISLRTTLKAIIRLNKIDWDSKDEVDRLAFEIKVMQRNGAIRLLDYFLLLEDVTNFVRSIGKYRGFGRGSGGGSLLTYVMDISDVQPLRYGLLFERFLTKERIGTYFFDIAGYDFKNKEEEDFTNPYYDKLLTMIDAKRSKEVNADSLEKELFYLECNANVCQYVYETAQSILSKNEKTKNENNSTVSYCLNITDIIPTDFIKSTPTTLPDFDYDTDARDEVKEYLTNKYGRNHVTLMGTIGTLKTKGALKDILRQLRPLKDSNGTIIKKEMTFDEVNELSKKFNLLKPTDFKSEIEFYEASIEADSGLKKWINDNKDIDEALRLILGNAKSTGIHAGGIVVSARDVLDVMPMTWSHDEHMWITQSEMAYVERVGLIKYDFLGLKTLGDLNRVLKLVNERHGTNYNLSNIPMDEKEVLKLFVEGKTESVFQFNTNLAISILTQLKEVRSILDLSMITSIARPGPLQMEMDKTFIARNTGKENVEYLSPTLAPILNETYGILCIGKGSKVLTKTGQKPIESVNPGEIVLTENGSWQKVLLNLDKGFQKTIKVRASNGEELICTPDHKVLTHNGWKEAGKLTTSDLIKSFWVNKKVNRVGDDQDWLIGLALADGDISGSCAIICCSNEAFAKKVKKIAENSFGLKNVRHYFRGRAWYVSLAHRKHDGKKLTKKERANPFFSRLRELNLVGLNCYTKRLPKNYSLAMLAGFIEGDGCLENNRIRLKNNELAYDLYLAFQSFRIPSSFFIDKDEVANVSFNDFENKLNFKIKKKKDKRNQNVFIPRFYLPKLSRKDGNARQLTFPSKAHTPLKIASFYKLGFKLKKGQHKHWSKVLSVKDHGKTHVFDLSIENVHSFVTGGIVTHNCYQEQVIQIAKEVGEFDKDSSVAIMKALSKKQLDKVLKFKEKFIKNAQTKDFTEAKATELWSLLEAFSSYGFNKSHAAAYACVSYLCMWFKHHYPLEWYSAVLTGADKEDFKVLYPKWKDWINRPDINLSKNTYVIDNLVNKVIMPLGAVNSVGEKAVENIVKNQPYSSFTDFYNRVDKSKVNKKVTFNLIFAGVFDSMKPADFSANKWRKTLIGQFFKLKHAPPNKVSAKAKEEDELFFKSVIDMNRGAMLKEEISLLNFTAFDYFEYYKDKMTDGARQRFGQEAISPERVNEYPDKATVVVGGAVQSIEFIVVKKKESKLYGKEIAKLTVSNSNESIEVMVFADTLEKDPSIRQLDEYTPIIIQGKVSRFNGKVSITWSAGFTWL